MRANKSMATRVLASNRPWRTRTQYRPLRAPGVTDSTCGPALIAGNASVNVRRPARSRNSGGGSRLSAACELAEPG